MIFKTLNPEDINITEYQSFASFDNTSSEVSHYIGEYTNKNELSELELSSGSFYKKLIYNSINNYFSVPPKIQVFETFKEYYGNRLKSNSINLTISSSLITDDGNGNLVLNENENYHLTNFLSYLTFDLNIDDYITDKGLFDRTLYNHKVNNLTAVQYTSSFGRFLSTTDYLIIDDNIDFKFSNDYCISVLISGSSGLIDKSNSLTTISNNRIQKSNGEFISTQQTNYSSINQTNYPFNIEVSGNILTCKISDSFDTVILSGSLTTNWNHVLFQRRNNDYELYINGGLSQSETFNFNADINNNCNIKIGNTNFAKLKIFKTSTTDVNLFYNYEIEKEYYVGKVLYDKGLIILTSQLEKFLNINESTPFTLTYKGVRTHYEHEYICTLFPHEFNNTLNPSITTSKYSTVIDNKFLNTNFNPYITTIGLYNDNAELIAIAKVSQAIKKLKNTELTFIIKFDI